MQATSQTLSILLPVRNEGLNLKIMLKILKAVVEVPHEVLVIVDRPDDSSLKVVEKLHADYPNLKSVENRYGVGILNALKAGVEAAKGEYVLIFAADEVGPVLAIEDMLALAQDEGCTFVSCTRYAHGGRRLGGSLIGKCLSTTANFLFHRFLGSYFTDATTGIKLFRKELFWEMNLKARPVGWAVVFEMAIKAQLNGYRLGEVPIVSIDRLYGGKSTFRLGPWVGEYLRWFVWGMKRLRKLPRKAEKPVTVRIPLAVQKAMESTS